MCRPPDSAYMSIRHVEALRTIRPFVQHLIEHSEEIFRDLRFTSALVDNKYTLMNPASTRQPVSSSTTSPRNQQPRPATPEVSSQLYIQAPGPARRHVPQPLLMTTNSSSSPVQALPVTGQEYDLISHSPAAVTPQLRYQAWEWKVSFTRYRSPLIFL